MMCPASGRLWARAAQQMPTLAATELRRLFTKELRPNFCVAGSLEKLMQAECVKRQWPATQDIAEYR